MKLSRLWQTIFTGAALSFAGSCAHLPLPEGNFRVHRWNQGSRAEARPIFAADVTDQAARRFLETGEINGQKPLYPGCFLVVYQPQRRSPASRDALVAGGSHKLCMEDVSSMR